MMTDLSRRAICLLICLTFASGASGFKTAIIPSDPSLLSEQVGREAAFHLSISDLEFKKVEKKDALLSSFQSLNVSPDILLTWGEGGKGFMIGYRFELKGEVGADLLRTTSDYMVNERRFTSRTELNLDYRVVRDEDFFVGAGKAIGNIQLGCRLSLHRQTLKKGEIVSEMRLSAVHGEDVNPNDPRQLIPAIVDGLKYSLEREDRPERDENKSALNADIGIGMRPEGIDGLRLSLIFRNLLFPQTPLPIRAGLAFHSIWEPRRWFELHFRAEKLLGMRPMTLIGAHLTGLQNGIGGTFSAEINLGGEMGRMIRLRIETILGGGRFGLSVEMKDGLSGVGIYQEHRF